jgi:hypothetical protein
MSKHPPKMMEGIILSLLKNHNKHNTFEKDYLDMALKLFTCHVQREWVRTKMRETILLADAKLRRPTSSDTTLPSPTTSPPSTGGKASKERIFLHMEYARNDLSQKAVRSILDDTMSGVSKTLGDKQVTTCYSCTKNVKDLVTKANLDQASVKEASKYYLKKLSAIW